MYPRDLKRLKIHIIPLKGVPKNGGHTPVLEFEACGFDVTSGLLDVFVQPLKLDVVEE